MNNNIGWIDSHAHLDLIIGVPDLSGLSGIITISTEQFHVSSLQKYTRLTSPWIFRTVGIHPEHAEEVKEWSWLHEACVAKDVVAIGEIGLDRTISIDFSTQITAFKNQIEIAIEHNLPIVIHSREAEQETLDLLRQYPKVKGLFHCFTGSLDSALAAINLGFYISFSGIVTFRKSHLPDVAKNIPIDKILIETDSPYLAPVPHRGKQNHPAYVEHVGTMLANILNVPIDVLKLQLYNNTCAAFNLSIHLESIMLKSQ